jgi:hypothetical protein
VRIFTARSPALWGLFVSINSNMSGWIHVDWARLQRSVGGFFFVGYGVFEFVGVFTSEEVFDGGDP